MKSKRIKKRKTIPEALGNRICGVWPYVVMLILDAIVHTAFFIMFGRTVPSFFRLFFSFIFFIYPLYYVADALWSLRPSVCEILSGRIQINRKYYMNTARRELAKDAFLPVTVSVPVYMEGNEIIFRTLQESMEAIRRYRRISRKEAGIVVSDDGLAPMLGGSCSREKAEFLFQALQTNPSMLTPQEKKAAERIRFYRENGIAFVVRPASGRAGLFKKASNLNYTLRLGGALSKGAKLKALTGEGGSFAGGYAEGDIETHEIILLLDKDSGVKERIIEAILPEFSFDEKLAYVQCATSAVNLYENYYTYATGHQINNLFHNIWPCKALQGFFVPLVGHNVFLRKSILEKSGLWSENRVSEDYDKAICFYSMGYHGKYAQLEGLEFTEYASRTFTEETGKQRRYAYGLFEMIFDGTVTLEKVRGCDFFYMLLYFFSVVNQVLLLPTVLLESYFGNIHLLWAGFLLCTLCFVFLPVIRGLVMNRRLPKEHSEKFAYTFLIAVSFVGHSFSFLAGACRYLANKIRENRTPFPSTNVDQLGYRFTDGVRLLFGYIKKNPLFLVIAFLCLDRGIFLMTQKGLEPMTAFTYGYIMFCAVLVPVLFTPQLFGVLGGNPEAVEKTEVEDLKHIKANISMDEVFLESEESRGTSPIARTQAAEVVSGDIESFLKGYEEALRASIPEENMPKELLSSYSFQSCLRKDPEGKKELYVLSRHGDNAKALLRITKDYPEEDALEEAKLLERLKHPGIPKVYGSYTKDGRKYLVREYVEGSTLHDIVTAGGALSAKDIFGITLKLTDILSYLHSQVPPVIHRDIKPQNIIVGRDGSIHLIDFGIARVHKEERRKDTSVILTLDYASPEQYGFEQTTPLSDIYSLGVVLLFLATGRAVRSGLEAQIVNNRLRNLIEQCIAFNPKARIRNVEEIRDFILHDKSRGKLKRRKTSLMTAAMLAVSVGLSALAYEVGFATEKEDAEKSGYEHGYEIGYTSGYDAVPIFFQSETESGLHKGSNPGNMAVSGGAFAAQAEGSVFYLAAGGIWRMSAGGTETELMVEDEQAGAISCCNGWLYYSSGDQIMQTNIYTHRSDLLWDGLPGELFIAEDLFYLRSKDGLHLLDLPKGEAAALDGLMGCEALNTDGESLYFINGSDRALYRSDMQGRGQEKLLEEECRSVCLSGKDLFCAIRREDGGALLRIDKTAGTKTLLEVEATMLNITEDSLFFLDLSDKTISRCSFDGRVREKISRNRAEDFNIAGGWIFYHNEEDGGRLWCVRQDGSNDHPLP